MRPLCRAFICGLRATHPVILVSGIVMSCFSLLLIEGLFHTSWISRLPEGYLLRHEKDLFTHVAHDLYRFKDGLPHNRNLYLMGGSAVAYAFEPRSFSAQLTELSQAPVDVYNFGIGRQSLLESLAFVDALPDRSGTVVIGLNPRLLSRRHDIRYERWRQNHLLIKSKSLNVFLEENAMPEFQVNFLFPRIMWRIKHQLWIHRAKFMRAQLPHFSYDPTWYVRPALAPEKQRIQIEKFVKRSEKEFDSSIDFNLRALSAIVALGERKGLKLVLVELPMNPNAVKVFNPDFLRNYEARMRRWSNEVGAHYLSVVTKRKLSGKDFVDAVHVLESGREQIQEASLAYLLPHFERPGKSNKSFALLNKI